MSDEILPSHRKDGLIADNTKCNIPYSLPIYTPAMNCYSTTTINAQLTTYELLQALQQMPQPDLNSVILDLLDFIYSPEDLVPIFEKSLALLEFKSQANMESLISTILSRVSTIRNKIKATNPEEYTKCQEDIQYLSSRIESDMRKLVRYQDASEIINSMILNVTSMIHNYDREEDNGTNEAIDKLAEEAAERIRKLVHHKDSAAIFNKLKSEIDATT